MQRREIIKLGAAALASSLAVDLRADKPKTVATGPLATVEKWGMFELPLSGRSDGNPFKDVVLTAIFTLEHRQVKVSGFYDGDGAYRVRFMPDAVGVWSYVTSSTSSELNGHTGEFECSTPNTPGNHGPIGTAHQYHFQYADGTPYFPFGTTTYAYLFTTEESAKASLSGMQQAHFNKTRVCVLPKPLGKGVQPLPFPSSGIGADGRGGTNDYTRFNPGYFQMLEKRLMELQKSNIEADLILFHPYDAWGYKSMPDDVDEFYLRYAIARLAAFRNVWWSIANEYDLVKAKTMSDWDTFFRVVQAEDPYSHLRSIHHSRVIYDHSKPWCTHASLQSYDFEKSASRRDAWNKPIIYDEIQYEGDVDRRWGNLSAEEMTRRFWLAIINGVYATHGEVFISETGESSWSDAGRLRGDSAPRIAFLRALIERITNVGLNEVEGAYYLSANMGDEVLLYYFDVHRPARYDFPLPVTGNYSATLIDPFNMTTQSVPGTFTGKSRITLSNKPYQAVLFQKVSSAKGKAAPSSEPQVPSNEP
jgi:hypothetical protein